MELTFYIFLGCLLFSTVEALQCYRCQNFVTDTDSELLEGLKSKSNPLCDGFTPLNAETVTCPSGNYKCGMVRGSSKINLLLAGSVTVSSTVRDCMPVVPGTPDGCVDNDSQANKLLKTAMNAVLSDVLGVTLDGNVCYCSEDLCSACEKGQLGIAGFCLPIWSWALIGLGGLVFLFLITCCCCCCCRCCRNRKSPIPQQPMVVVTTSAQDGSLAINNPGYGQAYPAVTYK